MSPVPEERSLACEIHTESVALGVSIRKPTKAAPTAGK